MHRNMLKIDIQQNTRSIVVGTEDHFKIYDIDSLDEVKKFHTQPGYIRMARVSHAGKILITVFQSSPRRLQIWDLRRGTENHEKVFLDDILSLHLNRNRLAVCLKHVIYIYETTCMSLRHTLLHDTPNSRGLCDLSWEKNFLAYPTSNTTGQVNIFDTSRLVSTTVFLAHDSVLAMLAFSPDGLKIATVSEKGTLVRVFSSSGGKKLSEFRRGLKRRVDMRSLGFSPCGKLLYCSSNTETVHIFRCEDETKPELQNGWYEYVWSYLPSDVSQERAFATVHLPMQDAKNIVSIVELNKELVLLVVTEEGILYIYKLCTEKGGELPLYKQHFLDFRKSLPPPTTALEVIPGMMIQEDAPVSPIPPVAYDTSCRGYLPVTSHTQISFRTSTPISGDSNNSLLIQL